MSVRKHRRDVENAVKEMTANYTISITQKGHIRVAIHGPLGQRCVIVASTASDHRWVKNFRADIVRAIIAVTPIDPNLVPK